MSWPIRHQFVPAAQVSATSSRCIARPSPAGAPIHAWPFMVYSSVISRCQALWHAEPDPARCGHERSSETKHCSCMRFFTICDASPCCLWHAYMQTYLSLGRCCCAGATETAGCLGCGHHHTTLTSIIKRIANNLVHWVRNVRSACVINDAEACQHDVYLICIR